MNNDNLFEMAALDALGLLEAEERREFEDAFESASPALREQIRREQSRLTDLDDSLPKVSAPESLRDRVLQAVHQAMAAMAPARTSEVIAKIGSPAWPTRRAVSPIWRAACIGFATATVVLIAVGFYMRGRYDEGLQAFRDIDLTQLMMQDLGSEFVDQLLSPGSLKVSFQPADNESQAKAMIFVDPETKTAYLVTRDLPQIEGEYRLVVVDDFGEFDHTVASFQADGALNGTPLNLNVSYGTPLAIFPPGRSTANPHPLLLSL